MKHIVVYTDGACSGNPGRGGWGAILEYGGVRKEISGKDEFTTNNKMELTAVIRALESLKEPCSVDIYSDSKYVVDSVNVGWKDAWKRASWTKKGKVIKNAELWMKLDSLISIHKCTFNWVKGHNGIENNERCDYLARR